MIPESSQPCAPVMSPAEQWDARYRAGDCPWDTGIVPPEVVALVSSGELAPGWALDLGCGSGVSSRYLAAHGFRVVGVDYALSALARGSRDALAAAVPAYFCRADVSNLGFLRVKASLALDVGCFHALPVERRPAYVASLVAHLCPQSFFLLYAFHALADSEGRITAPGIISGDLAAFAPYFSLRWVQFGQDHGRTSAWYLLRRTAVPL